MKNVTFSTILIVLFSVQILAQESSLRINTGGSEVDYSGEVFMADAYFDTGSTLARPQTGLPEPYQSFRYSPSQQMSYDIPLADGEYTVNLHFAELWFGATGGGVGEVGKRVFDVSLEGQLAEDNLDIFAEVGAEAMLIKSHTVTVTGGMLNIDFDSRDAVGGERHPVINAIEIVDEMSNDELTIDGFVYYRSAGSAPNSAGSLNDGDKIYQYEDQAFFAGFEAEGSSTVKSIHYQLVGPTGTKEVVRNISVPFWEGENIGTHTITATPFSELNGGGTQGNAFTITYEILDHCEAISIETFNTSSCYSADGYAILRDPARNNSKHGSNLDELWVYDEQLDAFKAINLAPGSYEISCDDRSSTTDLIKSFVIEAPANCAEPSDFALRINAGGSEVDYKDETFMMDSYFDTGSTLVRPQTGLPEPYRSFRYSKSQQMSYAVPMADGEYTVNLYFAELWFGATEGGAGGVGSRVFDVSIEGQLVEDNLDVFAEAGAEAMLVKTHTLMVTGGVLDIDFSSLDADGGERHPIINAIEIFGETITPVDPILLDLILNLDPNPNDINLTTSRVMYSGCTTCNSHFVANVNEGVGSVHFALNGPISFEETTNDVLGDAQLFFKGNNHILPPGAYTLTVTPYSTPNKGGEMGQAITTNFDAQEGIFTVLGLKDASNCTSVDGRADIATGGSIPDGSKWSHDPLLNGSAFAIDMSPGNYQVTIDWGNSDVIFNYQIKSLDGQVCPEPNDFALRINTGGSEADYSGETFMADSYFDTGSTLVRPQTGLPEPYQSFRYSPSQQMRYAISLEDGEYTVNLHFAELWFGATGGGTGGVGSRVFDVSLEGQLAEDNLDVFAEVGAGAMLVKSHTVTVTDGVLDIDFSSLDADGGERHPIINAIEILGTRTSTERPFITTRSTYEKQIAAYAYGGETYNYSVDWGDGSSDTGVTGNIIHTYSEDGNYQIAISGSYPRVNIFWDESRHLGQLISVDQWGTIKWTSMENAFEVNHGFELRATDIPDLSQVTSMAHMFSNSYAVFSVMIADWNVSNVTNMEGMFNYSPFNQDISGWDVSNVTDMSSMFNYSPFNQDISVWNVSNVTDMSSMFSSSGFNQDIGVWNVSNVTDMNYMFHDSDFNQDIGGWDVGNVTDMSFMFYIGDFNQDIGDWDVGNVINMSRMFEDSMFNHYIGDWNVSNVTGMAYMFSDTNAFNQDLGDWDVSNVTTMLNMFSDSGLSNENYDKTLIGWSQLPSLQNGVTLDAPQNQYCDAEQARQHLIDTYGWIITDAGKARDCNAFALRINTGGEEITYNGETFMADSYFDTGSTLNRPQTGVPLPFQTFRYSPSQEMSYDIPIPNGTYRVNLYLAELWFGAIGGGTGGVGSRVFDISIEGQLVQDNYDVYAEYGSEAAVKSYYAVTVTDGVLNIDFDSRAVVGGERHPIINAIEILDTDNGLSGKSIVNDIAQEVNHLILSPNPAVSTTSLSFEKWVQVSDIQVFDVSGRLVRTFNAAAVSVDGSYKIKVNDLESGTYFINAIDNQGVKHQKQMIVKRH